MSILSRKIYAACSSEIFLSEILVENQNCTISVGIFSVYISKGFIPFRNRVIPNAAHWWYVVVVGGGSGWWFRPILVFSLVPS